MRACSRRSFAVSEAARCRCTVMGLHTTLRDLHIRVVRISKRQKQLERLAWAGGFFDGEGSTFARSETARPGYRQLSVVVPQAGGFVVPEVLTRFAEALPGLGRIGGPSNG